MFLLGLFVFTRATHAPPPMAAVITWALCCGAANMLPVPAVGNVYLSMSSPVNIAIAALFAPGVGGCLVAGSSISEWEVKGETTLLHAIYNRVQLGVATAAASWALGSHAVSHPAPLRTLAAVAAYHGVNWGLVAAAESSCRRVPFSRALHGLLPAAPIAAVSYFVLGLMGVALAAVYIRIGSWAVVLLMLPLLGARRAVAASRQVEEAERAQRVLANRLIDERERERARIAADIHDVVLQDLAALQLITENVETAVRVGNFDMSAELAGQLRERAAAAISGLRASIASLRRTTFDEAGLNSTLARYARSFSTHSGVDVIVDADDGETLPLPVALLLYECTQEALTNVARHARATKAWVGLRTSESAVELRVADDGVGVGTAEGSSGSGLALMREKVELSGGTVTLGRGDWGGAEVRVRLPLWVPR